ncbi:MAG: PorP/SprF family type IX secretion system membrane protein [Chitinophagales bacterium]|nr:PorP/SprF family type IX secretion system membrane protein [Chitinophagales bacterium]
MRRGYFAAVIFWLFTGLSTSVMSQDIHFSQFTAAPLMLNPALSGLNGCDYRATAIFKGQWGGISANRSFAYRTLSTSFDMAMFKGPKYANFGGIGLSMYSDQAGDGNFSTNKVDVSMAYHIMLDKFGKQGLSIGIQGGLGHRSIDQSLLYFDTQFDPDFGFDPNGDKEFIERDKFFYGDIAAGLIWHLTPNERSNYYTGISITHLNQPNLSFQNQPSEKLYMKFSIAGGALIPLAEKFDVMPSFQVLSQGPAFQANIGSYLKFKTDPMDVSKPSVLIGSWVRLTNPIDGLIFAARTDFSGFSVAFSYDVTISSLSSATYGNGGPELSLIYTGCMKKAKSASYCPRL